MEWVDVCIPRSRDDVSEKAVQGQIQSDPRTLRLSYIFQKGTPDTCPRRESWRGGGLRA